MSLLLREFQEDDLRYVRQALLEPNPVNIESIEQYAKKRKTGGPAYTGVFNEEVIGCGGITHYWPGVAEAWLCIRSDATHLSRAIYRSSKFMIHTLQYNQGVKRLQCFVRADWPQARKFAARMGFIVEGLMRHYTPDNKDCYLMARIKL